MRLFTSRATGASRTFGRPVFDPRPATAYIPLEKYRDRNRGREVRSYAHRRPSCARSFAPHRWLFDLSKGMEDNTPLPTSPPPAARTAEALRQLHERARTALAAQRERMSRLESQLTEQLDSIALCLSSMVGLAWAWHRVQS